MSCLPRIPNTTTYVIQVVFLTTVHYVWLPMLTFLTVVAGLLVALFCLKTLIWVFEGTGQVRLQSSVLEVLLALILLIVTSSIKVLYVYYTKKTPLRAPHDFPIMEMVEFAEKPAQEENTLTEDELTVEI